VNLGQDFYGNGIFMAQDLDRIHLIHHSPSGTFIKNGQEGRDDQLSGKDEVD